MINVYFLWNFIQAIPWLSIIVFFILLFFSLAWLMKIALAMMAELGDLWDRFLDYLFPIFILMIPFLMTLVNLSQPPKNLLYIFIFSHFFLSFPILIHWANLRHWRIRIRPTPIIRLQPYLFLEILFSLSYSYVFFLAFLWLRYLRLHQDWDFSPIYENFTYLLFFPLAFSFLLPQIYAIFLLLRDLRGIFYLYLENISYFLHLYFLPYEIYFRTLSLLHKSYFSCQQFFFYPGGLYHRDQSLWLRFRAQIFLHFPLFLSFLCLIFLALEFILRQGHVHYSFDLFFYSFILLKIFHLWRNIGISNFSWIVCQCDYFYSSPRRLRFPSLFYHHLYQGDFSLSLDTQRDEIFLPGNIWKLRSKVPWNLHRSLLESRVHRAYPPNHSLRKASSFYKLNGIRFVHTSSLEVPLHNCTSLYAQSFLDLFSLLNSPQGWHLHYRTILFLEKSRKLNYPSSLYVSSSPSSSFSLENLSFTKVQEINFLDHFSPLAESGVKILPYQESLLERRPFLCQANPDVFFDFRNSIFTSQSLFSLDGKASLSANVGSNRIFHSMSQSKYIDCLISFQRYFSSKGNLSPKAKFALDRMIELSNDTVSLQIHWAENSHLFHENFLPPLRVISPISTEGFTQDFKEKYHQSHRHNSLVSKILYGNSIPQRKDFSRAFSQEDVMCGSKMQSLLDSQ